MPMSRCNSHIIAYKGHLKQMLEKEELQAIKYRVHFLLHIHFLFLEKQHLCVLHKVTFEFLLNNVFLVLQWPCAEGSQTFQQKG